MIPLTPKPFFETIYRLRSNEEILLFKKPGAIHPDDEIDVVHFLESEWDNECLEYPFLSPDFDKKAALWAARTVYLAAQLLLYRAQRLEELSLLFPAFDQEISPGSILSADLCLRTLPDLLLQARLIDPDDPLIGVAEAHLAVWHYSGIGYLRHEATPDFSMIIRHPTNLQLYTDRVIERKEKRLAALPELATIIRASMGDFTTHYWKE